MHNYDDSDFLCMFLNLILYSDVANIVSVLAILVLNPSNIMIKVVSSDSLFILCSIYILILLAVFDYFALYKFRVRSTGWYRILKRM